MARVETTPAADKSKVHMPDRAQPVDAGRAIGKGAGKEDKAERKAGMVLPICNAC